jgi:predicted amidohydrolase YtcJ
MAPPGRLSKQLGWIIAGLLLFEGACMKRVSSVEQGGRATVYLAKRIRTLDPNRPLAEAIAVRGEKIAVIGTRQEVLSQVTGAEVVELSSAVIVPGIEDAHAHLGNLGKSLTVLNLVGTTSKGQILELAKNAPASSYQGDWLIGRGWDQTSWGGGGEFPGREELDRLFPSTPVLLTRIDGHAVWVNGEALRRAGVSARTPEPKGGRIIRGTDGEPTGVLVDNAVRLVDSKLPPLQSEQLRARLRAALAKCAEVGLTGVHDAGTDLATFSILREWDDQGAVALRVYAMADGQGLEYSAYLQQPPFEGKRLTMRAVKFWLDGALGSRGAALDAPYSDEPSQQGLLLLEPNELEQRAERFMAKGFQVAVHAIGDRANRLALLELSKAATATKTLGGRHRIEHAQIIHVEDIPRFSQLGIIASMQPTHATSDMRWAEARLGSARIQGAYAWKTLLMAGARLAFGSDFPVENPNPLLGIYAARTRQDVHGQPKGGWMPQERLDGEEALRAFTVGAAFASFAEERRGTLAVGRDADFSAFSVDPVDSPAEELPKARAVMTVVGGGVVYRAEP